MRLIADDGGIKQSDGSILHQLIHTPDPQGAAVPILPSLLGPHSTKRGS